MDKIKQVLLAVGVGKEWWKEGRSILGPAIFLDFKTKRGLEVASQILNNHAGIKVGITTLILEEDYIELVIEEER